jgi:two-component system phosphate regulon response regulator OmpR
MAVAYPHKQSTFWGRYTARTFFMCKKYMSVLPSLMIGMNKNSGHILVVDDDERLRTLLRRYLHHAGYVVNTAEDSMQADVLLETFVFDAVILDRMLPERDGVAALSAWRGKGIETPVLMLTALGEAPERIQGLEAGADDYLGKPFEPKELLLRLQRLLKRQFAPVKEITLGALRYDKVRAVLMDADGGSVLLTTAEAALLDALAAKLNTPVARDDLASASGVNTRAIDVAVSRLRRKLGDSAVLQSIRGVGYKLVGQPC